jgi:DNA-binding MarR family transcriptional regulator
VVLGRFPGSTASEVVERTAMDKVSISRAVNNLVEKGLLQRRTDPNDRRRLRLYLTREQGKNVLQSIVPLAAAYEIELLESWDAEERDVLNELLNKLQAGAEILRDRLILESASAATA